MPPPPAELRGQSHTFRVTVRFPVVKKRTRTQVLDPDPLVCRRPIVWFKDGWSISSLLLPAHSAARPRFLGANKQVRQISWLCRQDRSRSGRALFDRSTYASLRWL